MRRFSAISVCFLFFLICISFFSFFYNFFEATRLGYISALVFNIIFIISFYFLRKKVLFIGVMLIYLVMFNFSVFVGDSELYYNQEYDAVFPYVVLPVLCFLLITPLVYIKRPELKLVIDKKVTLYLCLFLSPFILYSLFYLFPYAASTIVMGAKDVRTSLAENSVLPTGILTTLSVGVSLFYPLYIFLIFYCIVKNVNKLILFFMFLGVVSGILGALVFAARDRFLWIPLLFLVNYWLWFPYLSFRVRNAIKICIFIIGSLFLFGLIVFTVNRFSESNTGVLGSILLYFGAQPYIFAETLARHNSELFYGLSLRFPFFLEMLGIGFDPVVRDTPYQWMFGTLFSDFYLMGGWLYCLSFISLLNFYFYYLYKYNLKNTWLYVLLMLLHVQILAQGVFFFSFGFSGGNFYIFLTLILALILNFFSKVKFK